MARRWLMVLALAAAVVPAVVAVAWAGEDEGANPTPVLETEPLFDDDAGGNADADDPAIWKHPTSPGASLIVGTAKDAGLRVFDLRGRTVQSIPAPPAPGKEHAPGRFNNVDVAYGVKIGGKRLDLALVSDRGRDQIRAYAIDPKAAKAGKSPLRDVTSAHPPFVFSADQDEVDEQTSAYGLAAWRDPEGGGTYVVVSRRSRTEVALLRLVDDGGRVGYEEVDRLALPSTFTLPNGTTWSPCEDPGDEPQVEGTVVDAKRGIVFAAQEDVGVWRWSVSADGFGEPVAVDRVREYGVPSTFDEATEECAPSGADPGFGGRHLSADAEGLTIYYGRGDRGYLLASSQGDSTFAAYDRRGLGGFLGTFELRDGAVDGVQDSDGAAVLGNPLGKGFPKGLLVTHDGQNTPDVTGADGEVRPNTNFKLTRWEDVAAAFEPALRVDPDGPDPRTLQGAPADRAPVRFGTYNASLNRNATGDLVRDLSTPDNPQAAAVAEVIQRARPDVLLVNEFDFVEGGAAARLFRDNYLAVPHGDAPALRYPYMYVAPSNTGIASGFDLNNDGSVVTTPGAPGYGDDALGFGAFPGQFGMVVYSRYPIHTKDVRTFQRFLWKDMPGALLPDDPATAAPADWYSPQELAAFRLSSKSHWDLPIQVGDRLIHFLVSHPTPPVFDGPEDRNGMRNHDEIRFWVDYVTPGHGDYIYDDDGGRGGLAPGAHFVIAGDQNADPLDGDSVASAARQLLESPRINAEGAPTSPGADQQDALQKGANLTHRGNPSYDTADFADTTPGNLRSDYVLPDAGLEVLDAAVFWPRNEDPLFRLVGVFPFPTSDHKLVWVDLPGARSGR